MRNHRRAFLAAALSLPLVTRGAAGERPLQFGTTPVILDEQIGLLARWQRYLEEVLGRQVRFVQRGSYREIMDLLYRAGELTAAEVRERMSDPPGYSAVRTLLRILEQKGHVRHEQRGPRYVFSPVVSRARARRSALRALVQTFFDGSPGEAAAALIDESRASLGADELDRLAGLIDAARREGR